MPKEGYISKQIVWRGINIEIRYCHKWLKSSDTSHMELDSFNVPNPITGTGYRSHFFNQNKKKKDWEELVVFVTEWLERKAKGEDWIEYQKQLLRDKQLKLF